MVKFALLGNGPITNRGCEAIVLSTIRILEQEFGKAEFLLASFAKDSADSLPGNVYPVSLPYLTPRWSKAWWEYRINQFLRRPENVTGVLRPLKGNLGNVAAALSIGGDGYAIDYGHLIVDRLMVMDKYVQSLGIPSIIWGASIGPFDQEPEFESRIAQHFADLDLIVVREPVSLAYLRELGVSGNVCLAPDPAFTLASTPCALPERVQDILAQQCIGLNLSPLLAKYTTNNDFARWITLASEILSSLLEELGLPVLLIPHVTSQENNVFMDDELFLARVLQSMPSKYRQQIEILPGNLNSENLKWVIGQTMLFVGARTHSTIAALSSCIPCLSLAYSRKAWGINELVFGHCDWVLSPKDLCPERLCERVTVLKRNSNQVRLYLSNKMPELITEAFAAGRRVKEIVTNHC